MSQGWKPYGRDIRLGAEHDSPTCQGDSQNKKKVAPESFGNDQRREVRKLCFPESEVADGGSYED